MRRSTARLRKLAALAVGTLIVCLSSAGPSRAGYLVAWGRDDSGQTYVPEGHDFVAITAAETHCVALKSDGSLASWGSGRVVGFVPVGNDFAAVATGSSSAVAMRTDGSLFGWLRTSWPFPNYALRSCPSPGSGILSPSKWATSVGQRFGVMGQWQLSDRGMSSKWASFPRE